MAQRVAVFIDYQNVYRRAREAFGFHSGGHVDGQVRPLALGVLVKGLGAADRQLVAVHAYRGLPSAQLDNKGYDATQRQIAAWEANGGGIVHAHVRPLNYSTGVPREKGVDVQLAIDVVMGAMRKDYDVAVIASDDTDLHPAAEAVGELLGPGHCELAGWRDPARSGPRIVRSGGQTAYTHLIDRMGYERVRDMQDYTLKSARKPRPVRVTTPKPIPPPPGWEPPDESRS